MHLRLDWTAGFAPLSLDASLWGGAVRRAFYTWNVAMSRKLPPQAESPSVRGVGDIGLTEKVSISRRREKQKKSSASPRRRVRVCLALCRGQRAGGPHRYPRALPSPPTALEFS